MLKTRNVFVLTGNSDCVSQALSNLQFKGLTVFNSQITIEDITKEFDNNKSIVCSSIAEDVNIDSIQIPVVSSDDINISECINIQTEDISEQFEKIALSLNCDIGDHKSNSSGLSGVPSKKDCAYCVHMNKKITEFKYGFNRTVYESDNFIVLPTVGEFIKGYMLIIPKEHIMSLAELSPDLKEEFLEVYNDVITMLKLTYGIDDFLVWENGTGNGGVGKAKSSIVHAHVHVAPSKLVFEDIKKASGFQFKKISYDEIFSYGNHSYLLVKGNSTNEWFINDNPDLYIPRQYVRQLVAKEYNLPGDTWNWRINPFYDLLYECCLDIGTTLWKNGNEISTQIKERTSRFIIK